ncbi:MAG: ectoine/hydroxyectoine ABC transporter permease subunit EhuC [Streptosporangiales bacterium]|nr:ectoine/hydroxyectoine ABC transporter permease subunit EhuC [Streptosporangiales bacterium]
MSVVLQSFPLLLQGLILTLEITAGGAVLALVLAFLAGLAGTARSRILRAVSRVYVEFFRGSSALVLMFWFFFALPLIGFRFEAVAAAIIALGLNVGAYGGEVVRGAILSIPPAQYEATIALNMSPALRMRRVILPQAWASMLPPFGNLLIELLKATAVAALITINELTFVGQQQRAATGESLPIYTTVLFMYFVVAQVLIFGMRRLELRTARSLGRAPAARRGRRPALAGVGDGGGSGGVG